MSLQMASVSSSFKHSQIRSLALFCIVVTSSFAQEAIVVSGGEATGSGGNSSYTVGQMILTTDVGSSGSLSQGIQQPFEITTVSSIPYANPITLGFSIGLKQNSHELVLNLNRLDFKEMSYELISASGQVLLNQKINSEISSISISSLAESVYFLKIIQKNNLLKTFKINKGISK